MSIQARRLKRSSLGGNGRQIFVSLTGSDTTGDGSIARPYRTVTKAWSQVTPGSTIEIRGGTYLNHEVWILRGKSGTASAPITVRGYRNETVILDGETRGTPGNLTGDWNVWDPETQNPALIKIDATSYLVLENIQVWGSPYQGIGMLGTSSNCTLRNIHTQECQQAGIKVSGDNIIVDNCTGTNLVLANYQNSSDIGGWSPAFTTVSKSSTEPSTNITFQNCRVWNVWGEGIDMFQVIGFTLRNNIVHNAYSVNIYMDNARDGIMEHNYVWNSPDWIPPKDRVPRAFALGCEDYSSIGWTNYGSSNITIKNNYFINCKATCTIDVTSEKSHDIYVCFNTFINTAWESEISGGGIIQNNIFTGAMSWYPGYTLSDNCFYGVPAVGLHATTADPKFINPEGNTPEDFKISATSPVATWGTSIAGITDDYFGNTRPTVPALGAHQPI